MDLRTWILDDHAAVAQRFATAIAAHVPQDRWCEQPGGEGASIAWLLFHVTYHEDLAVQGVLQGNPALLAGHRVALGIDGADGDVGLGEADLRAVTDVLRPAAVTTYAQAVHQATRAWLEQADLRVLDTVPDAVSALQAAGIPEASAPWLHRMWAGRPSAWFVRWEAIGHPQGHVGEMVAVRGRLGCSPF
jgi:hypothetical protein